MDWSAWRGAGRPIPIVVSVMLTGATACGEINPAYDGPGASGTGAGSATDDHSHASTAGDGAGATSDSDGGGAGSGAGGTGSDAPTSGSAGSSTGATATPSAGTTPGTTSGPPVTSTGAGSTTSPGTTEHLQNYPGNDCDQPLWCYQGDIFNGAGDPIWVQECFMASLPPPFEVTHVHYIVGATESGLGGFDLEVRQFNGTAPGSVIDTVGLSPGPNAQDGDNDLTLSPPIAVSSPGFCVGFAAEGQGQQATLGIAVDTTSAIPDVSFYRLDGPGACDLPNFTDIIDDQPTPTGNLCIDVDVRTP